MVRSKQLQRGAKLIAILLLMSAIAGLVSALPLHKLNASGRNFLGYSVNMERDALKAATNTYNYDAGGKADYGSKNSNTVSSEAPQVTVLMHGLGGGAEDWSNNFHLKLPDDKYGFTYDRDSLIFKLAEQADAEVYWAKSTADYFDKDGIIIKNPKDRYERESSMRPDLELMPLSLQKATAASGQRYNDRGATIQQIDNINRHIIVVYQSSLKNVAHDLTYKEFDYILDKIVYDIKTLNSGVLPRLNLIGHSRGGIINMMYAQEHPDLVHSLYSIGTPYTGSNTAVYGAEMIGWGGDGVDDIVNADIYRSMMNNWNNNYDTRYSHIKVEAIGAYMTIAFMKDILYNKKEVWGFGLILDPLLMAATLLRPKDIALYAPIFGIYGDEKIGALLRTVECIDFWDRIFYDDTLVHLSSQLGVDMPIVNTNLWMLWQFSEHYSGEYKGFGKHTVKYTRLNTNMKKVKVSALNQYKVAHNLEAYAPYIHNIILDDIETGVVVRKMFGVHETETEAEIYAYYGKGAEHLTIPGTINGKTVKSIYPSTFAGNTEIKKITIPKSLESIDWEAFSECINLERVEMPADSMLKSIGDGVFAGCVNLKYIGIAGETDNILPDSVEQVASYAFSECAALTNMSFGKNISYIGSGVFLGSGSMQSIAVNQDNINYTAENNVLYSKDKSTLVAYPLGLTADSFAVPIGVKEIEEDTFGGNTALTSIMLPASLEIINAGAFADCVNLGTIAGGANVRGIYEEALSNTPYIAGGGEIISIGKVLIKYNGTSSVVDESLLGRYNYIYEKAFFGNANISKVIISDTTFFIGDGAFSGAENLETVIIKCSYAPTIGRLPFDMKEGLKIYIAKSAEEKYLKDYFWKQYRDYWEILYTKVDYVSNGVTIKSMDAPMMDVVDWTPQTNREHYIFLGWYDGEGADAKEYYDGRIWDKIEDTVMYARFSPEKYIITFETNGGQNTNRILYTYNEEYILADATKDYYIFEGWYDNPQFLGSRIEKIDRGEFGHKKYYAKFSPKKSNLTCVIDGVAHVTEVEYGSADYTLPELSEPGRIFLGWYCDEIQYSTEGIGFKSDIYEDALLTPKWKYSFQLKVKLTADFNWLGIMGVSDTVTSITPLEREELPEDAVYKSLAELEADFAGGMYGNSIAGHYFAGFSKSPTELIPLACWVNETPQYADGEILEIYPHFVKEVYRVKINMADKSLEYLIGYAGSINIESIEKRGYTHTGWRVTDSIAMKQNGVESAPYDLVITKDSLSTAALLYDLTPRFGSTAADIEIEPILTANTYHVTIQFFADNIKIVDVEYDNYLSVITTRPGYTFGGFLSDKPDVNGKYLIEMTSNKSTEVWTIEGNANFSAKWTPIIYTLTFHMEKDAEITESFLGEDLRVRSHCVDYTIETETFDLPIPLRIGYVFVNWSDGGRTLSKIQKGTMGNFAVVDLWRGQKHTNELAVNNKIYNLKWTSVNNGVIIVDYSALAYVKNVEINVESDIEQITFIDAKEPEKEVAGNTLILIIKGSSNVIFSNFKFCAPDGLSAIYGKGAATDVTNMTFYGNCLIKGGKGAKGYTHNADLYNSYIIVGKTGENALSFAHKLNLIASDYAKVVLYGGEGGDGGDGARGNDGIMGEKGVWPSNNGKTGGQGGSGFVGGQGGIGGYSLSAANVSITGNIYLKGGFGGTGGTGGIGGTGGTGGTGCNGQLLVTVGKGGTGGIGGTGGTGGSGGTAGTGSSINISGAKYLAGFRGRFGVGGLPGGGGLGGSGGLKLNGKDYGARGNNGAAGNDGNSGSGLNNTQFVNNQKISWYNL